MTSKELALVGGLKNLTHLEISSGSLTTIPTEIRQIGTLTHLSIQSNRLQQLDHSSLSILESLKKVRIGGNSTRFACDCDSPTDLQRWLLDAKNRVRVEDIDDVYCDLNKIGVVPIIEALPGTNESVCVEPTEETKQWMIFVDNAKKEMQNETIATTQSTSVGPEYTIESETTSKTTTTRLKTSSSSISRGTTTSLKMAEPTETVKLRKKFHDVENEEPHKFVNALIFILFICVLILIISIGVTIYYKFLHPDKELFKRKKASREHLQPLKHEPHNSS
ncbi:unnamed protein product [Caenorhabditis bovis]|uniref:LRRCT domain-containing protein n=1 Tax=Caenorhabditis bovis TaxID=2654633 RepID=A0A8S1EPR5_9PELO|nr:unnamed protein product [Caenorhabditis bovis]